MMGAVIHCLTTEYRVNPVGMDVARPRLSWKLPDGGVRNVMQVAYRIRVATSPDRLAAPDVWDSGEVASPQSVNVEYAGPPLEPSREYFWTVETLDNHGRRAISDAARWRTGLLRPEHWAAKWITVNPETLEGYDLKGAEWVAASENAPAALTFEAEPDDIDPRAAELTKTRGSWRPSFDVYRTKPAILACAASGDFTVEVNGRTALKLGGGPLLRYVDVAGHLKEGMNTVCAVVATLPHDSGDAVATTPRGAFLASLSLPGGRTLVTGREWRGTPVAQPFGGRLFRTVEKVSPAFRKTFRIDKPVRDAVLHITGLGFYEASLDGKRIGRKVLDPAPTDYDDRVLYSTYELADALATPGEHVLDVLLGRGAYDIHVPEVWNLDESPWRAPPCLIAQLEIRYADGSSERLVTDGSWRQIGSSIVWDDLREGEIHAPGRAPQIDLPAAVTAGPSGRLEAMPLPGAEKVETWHPASIEQLANGHWTVDFGQNLSGWLRLRMRGLATGDVVTVQYCEKRNEDGSFRLDGNDMYFQYPHSVLRMPGGWLGRNRHVATGVPEETFEPKFSYGGFRYAEIGGLRKPLHPDDIEAYQINTAFRPAGAFECSNDLFNSIHRLFVRAYMSNFTDGVPTDCPQREKNGWTGDAQLAAEMAQYCFENTAGYEKWCRDLVDAQLPDGGIPRLAPFSGWGAEGAGPAWDEAIAVVPWTLYRYRGDRRILEETYSALRRYILWGETRLDGRGLADYGLEDWCPPLPRDQWRVWTPVSCTSTACWYQAVRIAAEAARVLGRDEDASRFAALAGRTQKAAREAFQAPDGRWSTGTQAAQAVALGLDLVAPEMRGQAAARLRDAVEESGRFIKCGIIGAKWLFRALCDTGSADLAATILSQTTSPSFGDWLAKGASTAWESWTDPASQNHVMFGDVSAWFFQYPGGIRLDDGDDAVGFRRILLAPETTGLAWVKAYHDCPYGTIRSEWRIDGDRFDWTIEIPPNTTATAVLPRGFGRGGEVGRDGGRAVATFRFGRPAWRLGSGVWHFQASTSPDPRKETCVILH